MNDCQRPEEVKLYKILQTIKIGQKFWKIFIYVAAEQELASFLFHLSSYNPAGPEPKADNYCFWTWQVCLTAIVTSPMKTEKVLYCCNHPSSPCRLQVWLLGKRWRTKSRCILQPFSSRSYSLWVHQKSFYCISVSRKLKPRSTLEFTCR